VYAGGTFGLGLVAVLADAKKLQQVAFNSKAVFGADIFFDLLDQALVEVHALAAFFTDQVVVMLARVDHLIAALAIAQDYFLDQTLAHQRLKRAVNSGQTRTFCVVSAHQPVNVLGTTQLVKTLQILQDLFTAFSELDIVGIGCEGAVLMVCHSLCV
jgi:hypothetical protein